MNQLLKYPGQISSRKSLRVIARTALTSIVAIAIAMSVATSAKASTTHESAQPEKLQEVLQFVFNNEAQKQGWSANYEPLWCPSNVFNLLLRLKQANVDLERAQVHYIIPDYYALHKGISTIQPREPRKNKSGSITEWSFHVVLEIDGYILDPDFTQTAQVVTVADYYGKMFGKGPKTTEPSKQSLYLRKIPAPYYIEAYTGNYNWYLSGGEGRFKAKNLDAEFAPPGTYNELPFTL